MPERDASAKLRIYFTIYRLNLSFANIVANCRALGESGILSPKFTRLYQSYAQELQAEINEDVMSAMTRLSPTTSFGSAKRGWRGRRNCATRTMFLFTPRNGAGNWQDKARNRPLSKAAKHSALSRALPARQNRPHLTPLLNACGDDKLLWSDAERVGLFGWLFSFSRMGGAQQSSELLSRVIRSQENHTDQYLPSLSSS